MTVNMRVKDVGTKMTVTILDENNAAVDISTVTTKEIWLRKPNGEVITKTASFDTDGTDGKLKYITIEGDVEIAGTWKLQGYIEGSTVKWHSTIEEFDVDGNLK